MLDLASAIPLHPLVSSPEPRDDFVAVGSDDSYVEDSRSERDSDSDEDASFDALLGAFLQPPPQADLQPLATGSSILGGLEGARTDGIEGEELSSTGSSPIPALPAQPAASSAGVQSLNQTSAALASPTQPGSLVANFNGPTLAAPQAEAPVAASAAPIAQPALGPDSSDSELPVLELNTGVAKAPPTDGNETGVGQEILQGVLPAGETQSPAATAQSRAESPNSADAEGSRKASEKRLGAASDRADSKSLPFVAEPKPISEGASAAESSLRLPKLIPTAFDPPHQRGTPKEHHVHERAIDEATNLKAMTAADRMHVDGSVSPPAELTHVVEGPSIGAIDPKTLTVSPLGTTTSFVDDISEFDAVDAMIGGQRETTEISSELRLQLDSPDLGTLWVSVRETQGSVMASIETNSGQAYDQLMRQLHALREHVQEAGISLGSLELGWRSGEKREEHREQSATRDAPWLTRELSTGTKEQASRWHAAALSGSHLINVYA